MEVRHSMAWLVLANSLCQPASTWFKFLATTGSAATARDHPGVSPTAVWSKTQYIRGSDSVYGYPESAAHSVGGGVTIQPAGGRFSGGSHANFDLQNRTFVQQRILASSNAQCCGVTVDYQSLNAGRFSSTAYPADRRFGISFSLAGIGSFTNPFGSFGENAGR